MRLLVTGSQGQVVSSIAARAQSEADLEVMAIGRPRLDLENPTALHELIQEVRPDVVVSAAAYTAVDKAEDEPDIAFAVNAVGAGKVAGAAAEFGVPVIHLSTDYVFDGTKNEPYIETDETGPRSVYGASKLAGERAVAAANPQHLIFRTAWVYSRFGKNFVKTMLQLAATRDELSVVADQWGNPTSADDIADGVLTAGRWIRSGRSFDRWGIYHLAGTGETNWSGFARHVLDTSAKFGGPGAIVKDIATSQYPTKAQRPTNSRLSTERIAAVFGWTAPEWRHSAERTVAQILHSE